MGLHTYGGLSVAASSAWVPTNTPPKKLIGYPLIEPLLASEITNPVHNLASELHSNPVA